MNDHSKRLLYLFDIFFLLLFFFPNVALDSTLSEQAAKRGKLHKSLSMPRHRNLSVIQLTSPHLSQTSGTKKPCSNFRT